MTRNYHLPVTMEQIAYTIRKMSQAERATLQMLVDGALGNPAEPSPGSEGDLSFNGINGLNSRPLNTVSTPAELFEQFITVGKPVEDELDRLMTLHTLLNRESAGVGTRGVIEGVDVLKPEEAGWGVIYPNDTPPEVVAALKPLVDHRKAQCGRDQNGLPVDFREDPADFENGYDFRYKYNQEHGPVDPEKLPYYLLIIGPPTRFSFKFQYGLDTQHAVGRIHFGGPDDYDAEGYRQYVQRLLAYENKAIPITRARRLIFFSTAHDEHTVHSDRYLAGSLCQALNGFKTEDGITYSAKHIRAEEATKARLEQILRDDSPTLIFTATHGLGYPGADDQTKKQGSILCQVADGDYARDQGDAIPDSQFLSSKDIGPELGLDGLVVFAFGCYTAGTPKLDDYPHLKNSQPAEIASQPFVADLPQRLLAQGALAFVGHVERAWFYSFSWPGLNQEQTSTFKSVLEGVLKGHPIGDAVEDMQLKYLDLNHSFVDQGLIKKYGDGDDGVDKELTRLWTATTDARSYILLGDPLVCLRSADLTAADIDPD